MQHLLEILTSARFLTIGGTALTVLGIAGVVGVLRRLSSASVFNPPYWINWARLTGGVLILLAAMAGTSRLQNGIVLFGALVGTTVGMSGLLFGHYFAGRFKIPELADPSDHLAHLVVGLAALWA